jgi:hypothetical protein
MFEVFQNAQAVGDDLVAGDVADIGNEADTASIVLVTWIIKPVRGAGAFGEKSRSVFMA